METPRESHLEKSPATQRQKLNWQKCECSFVLMLQVDASSGGCNSFALQPCIRSFTVFVLFWTSVVLASLGSEMTL